MGAGGEQTGGVADAHAVRTAPAASHLSTRQPEYTQHEHSVSKIAGSIHPDGEARDTVAQQPPKKPDIEWQTYSVRRGDTLGKIFNRFSVDIGLASRVAADKRGAILKKLLPGRKIWFGFNDGGKLVMLRYELDQLKELVVDFEKQGGFKVSEREIPIETRERRASGVIGSSLFVSASKAGLSNRLIMDLVSIFGWEIDFALDIRSGDRFSIIYDELLENGETIGTGEIIAAEFVNQGRVYHAIRHVDDEGHREYFDLEGNSLRGTFLKTPMRVSRITSGFSKARYHPVLKKWRAHRGVDYGAPPGTPVLATGDGRVHFVGRNGGYGNTVVLKHGGQYSTLYAHLSGFKKGLGRGTDIQQGDVIGYVGSTGLVTGPHLHYEFRVNGKHRDPLSYETPKAAPIADRYRDNFLVRAQNLIEEIAEIRPEQVASR
jgi:murein DD-endopeptidase MepM/ murein hydrolase activator NlpD